MQVGDQVRLKSGGPTMTVCEINENTITCRWFDGAKLKEHEFRAVMLMSPSDRLEKEVDQLLEQLKEIDV